MRLQKFMAHAGVASRRRSEELIEGGHVRVNGRVVRELGTTVAPEDRVEVNGTPVLAQAFRYLVLNKPVAVVTTMHDPEGRRTVGSLVSGSPRVVPVGRLDYESAGVLLLTNDGDLAHLLTHPRHGVDKTYRAVVRGRLTPAAVSALRSGVRLDDGLTGPVKLRVVAASGPTTHLDLTIHEGRNREVRRLLERVGHPVLSLVRLRFGPISLGSLGPGQTRGLSEREHAALEALRRSAGP